LAIVIQPKICDQKHRQGVPEASADDLATVFGVGLSENISFGFLACPVAIIPTQIRQEKLVSSDVSPKVAFVSVVVI
jgi:hypothetical protein